ncbi:aminodeoxychorismate synthase component I [Aliagarivorans marinus]|uniref:aminodeoxychorismate synthase component I n=1 Tax=Aliagarivorans marinus TaxID=561965 RepID=UPI00047A5986|nr:aminodeoxychorismate synthase component I [Aliagarivorans marinus]
MVRIQPLSLTLDHILPALSQQVWSCFLQSASQDHPDSQFDIIVADPIATLCYQDGQGTQLENGVVTSVDGNPFTQAQQLRQRLFSEGEHHALPFSGGCLGLWGYDLGRSLERMPEIAEQDIATPDMALGYYDWAIIHDKAAQQLLLVSYSQGLTEQAADAKLAKRLEWLQQLQTQAKPAFALSEHWQSNLSEAQYRQRFDQVQEYLKSGDCYEINLTQRFSSRYQGDEFDAYQRLLAGNQAPFSAFMRLPQSCILSVSPERFIAKRGSTVETKPIKGTRKRGATTEQDQRQKQQLRQSEKDQAENLMIVDLLRNDIGRVAIPGTVRVPKLFEVESFPAVHHLVSTVTAELPDSVSAEQLLAACFPGGSITGAPKIRAMEIIEELEPHRRNAYCGAIGYINHNGDMDTNITIRTLVCEQGKIHCWAGGAVVVDSEVEQEYQECFDKLSRILPALST